jgi:aryl-alcohol dehydrogenase-like predicted oxidoreductase
VIDVYSYARLPPNVPAEELFKTLKELRDEGLFTAVGASETSANTLEKVSKVRPLISLSSTVAWC